MKPSDEEVDMDVLSETENFTVMRTRDSEGTIYHVELGGVSLHLEPDEWEELIVLIRSVGL